MVSLVFQPLSARVYVNLLEGNMLDFPGHVKLPEGTFNLGWLMGMHETSWLVFKKMKSNSRGFVLKSTITQPSQPWQSILWYSMDWLKGKLRGNHDVSYQTGGRIMQFFPLNQMRNDLMVWYCNAIWGCRVKAAVEHVSSSSKTDWKSRTSRPFFSRLEPSRIARKAKSETMEPSLCSLLFGGWLISQLLSACCRITKVCLPQNKSFQWCRGEVTIIYP